MDELVSKLTEIRKAMEKFKKEFEGTEEKRCRE